MDRLWLYRALSRAPFLNYRAKIMVTAFLGTHVPLITLIAFFAWYNSATTREALITIGVALVATLAGTGVTLFVLNHLLRPILMTGSALRSFMTLRVPPALPTQYGDEAGRLMADASHTMTRLEVLLDQLEHFDTVTSLPNRQGLVRALSSRLRDREASLGLAAIRYANHGRITSTFGQDAADTMVRLFADRLQALTGVGRILSRVDPDLFVMTLGAESPEAMNAEFEALSAKLCAEMVSGTLRIMPEVSCGVAVYPFDGTDAETLLNSAMLALSQDDHAAPGITFFSPASKEAARRRFVMEQDLRRALAEDEFLLHFQPVIDGAKGTLVGAEALIRWQHPELGMVPPNAFIPLAENAGLAPDLDNWVLRTACREAGAWRASGLPIKVAVNMSARHFRDGDLLRVIDDNLRASGLVSSGLEIELTETAAMEDGARTREIFLALQEMGVSIAIDDFGTGYSSMSYLKNLPFNKLKIDREFVRDVHIKRDSVAICRALIELSHGLGLEVLTEGTEKQEEVQELLRQGCSLFQGFYFSKPLPAADFRTRATGAGWSDLLSGAAAAWGGTHSVPPDRQENIRR